MEKKINLVELLKKCLRGMELDCTCADNVVFDKIIEHEQIKCVIGECRDSLILDKYGRLQHICCPKCVIFPKCKTTWEGFVPPCQFKDGDIVYVKTNRQNEYITIFKEIVDNHVYTYACFSNQYFSIDKCAVCHLVSVEIMRLATEAETEKLFQAIKDHGYKWNAETKTLEKLIIPKFKVGDRVKKNKDYISGIVTNISDDDSFKVEYQGGGISYVSLAYQDEWELVPDKFDINTLKTFDQVLVRLTNNCVWMPKLFSHYDTDSKGKYYPFVTIDNLGYPQCIPYNGNEHLRRTTNNCDEFYRVWEE